MRTILAFSDSHSTRLPQKLVSVANESDYVFFLGDGVGALGDLLFLKNLYAVDGNCDTPCFGNEKIIEIDGVRILLTHGHKHSVKRDLLPLALYAKEKDCRAVFYGHTHTARIDEYQDVTLICPGSPSFPQYSEASYAYAVAHNGKLTVKIVNINN